MKTHLYWAIKNYGDSPSKLQELILNIPCDYQVHLHFYNTDVRMHHHAMLHNSCTHIGPALQMPILLHTTLHTK